MKPYVLIIALSFAACKATEKNSSRDGADTSNSKIDGMNGKMVFGKFCGHCLKDCSDLWLLKPDSQDGYELLKNGNDNYLRGGEPSWIRIKSSTAHQLAAQVLKKIPETFRSNPDTLQTYGCPDCYDQCGYLLEFDQDSVRKKVRMDTNKETLNGEVRSFADLLDSSVQKLKALEK
jgi:hypothetical protein